MINFPKIEAPEWEMFKMSSAWSTQAKLIILEFDGNTKYKHPGWKRVGGKCVTPVGCMPCFLWSFVMRVLACPIMCACKGPGFMCSDNGCTMMTDKCFAASWTAYDEVSKLPKIPDDVTKEELLQIYALIEKCDYIKRYKLCEMLFGNTLDDCSPFRVGEFIANR